MWFFGGTETRRNFVGLFGTTKHTKQHEKFLWFNSLRSLRETKSNNIASVSNRLFNVYHLIVYPIVSRLTSFNRLMSHVQPSHSSLRRNTDLSLMLEPSAKRGAHVVWFSGETETRRLGGIVVNK